MDQRARTWTKVTTERTFPFEEGILSKVSSRVKAFTSCTGGKQRILRPPTRRSSCESLEEPTVTSRDSRQPTTDFQRNLRTMKKAFLIAKRHGLVEYLSGIDSAIATDKTKTSNSMRAETAETAEPGTTATLPHIPPQAQLRASARTPPKASATPKRRKAMSRSSGLSLKSKTPLKKKS